MWLKDATGAYRACNAEFEKFFGAPAAGIIGQRDQDFVSTDQAAAFARSDQVALHAQQPIVSESRITYASDGRQRLMQAVKTPLRDERGQLLGVLGIARDITELSQTQDALKKVNRASRLLGESSAARIRARSEAELLQRVCDLAVGGGYLMGWVGMAEQDETRTVRPVARAGAGLSYLDTTHMSWVDDERGGGPCGIAVPRCATRTF